MRHEIHMSMLSLKHLKKVMDVEQKSTHGTRYEQEILFLDKFAPKRRICLITMKLGP